VAEIYGSEADDILFEESAEGRPEVRPA
jgi:hypothetical protein